MHSIVLRLFYFVLSVGRNILRLTILHFARLYDGSKRHSFNFLTENRKMVIHVRNYLQNLIFVLLILWVYVHDCKGKLNVSFTSDKQSLYISFIFYKRAGLTSVMKRMTKIYLKQYPDGRSSVWQELGIIIKFQLSIWRFSAHAMVVSYKPISEIIKCWPWLLQMAPLLRTTGLTSCFYCKVLAHRGMSQPLELQVVHVANMCAWFRQVQKWKDLQMWQRMRLFLHESE